MCIFYKYKKEISFQNLAIVYSLNSINMKWALSKEKYGVILLYCKQFLFAVYNSTNTNAQHICYYNQYLDTAMKMCNAFLCGHLDDDGR